MCTALGFVDTWADTTNFYCLFSYRENCEYSIHGTHLPHVVLKDNDFRRKLRVLPDTGAFALDSTIELIPRSDLTSLCIISICLVADELVSQLAKDSTFLCEQGIMDYSLLLSVHSTKYVVDHSSFDASSLIKSPTKRKVNYPVCHPDGEDSFSSLFNDLEHTETSSDEDLADIESGNRQKFNRSCRYSVMNDEAGSSRRLQIDGDDQSDKVPLLSPTSSPSLLRYDSMSFTKPFEIGSPIADQSKWVGSRSLAKAGYQAYAVVGPDYYTLGVVDMLQTWTWRKRLERLWKTLVLRHDGFGISAAPPKLYADRFQRKMRDVMMVSSSQIGFGNH